MKYLSFKLVLIIVSSTILMSCKKDKSEPAPTATTPAVNQVSANAPNLGSGSSTSFTASSNESKQTFYLDEHIVEPQGDDWNITSISSSNTNIVEVNIKSGDTKNFEFDPATAGRATITIVVSDVHGNSNTLTFTIRVSNPIVEEEPNNSNAPRLTTSYNISILAGSNSAIDFTNTVTEPQGDDWSVTSVTSSNTNIATVNISGSNDKSIEYVGVNSGSATLTVTISDEYSNSNTFTIPITVVPKPIKVTLAN